MKTIGLGLVGCGVVGGGLVKALRKNSDLITQRSGLELNIARVAVRDIKKDRGIDPSCLTTEWLEVIQDPKVQVVIELMGGTDTSYKVVQRAIESDKPVVTANKALLAERGESLFALATERKVPLYFEASVAGGIPIVQALTEGLQANHIKSIHGIINGTCNYIMTRMASEGADFETILADAKRLGYAETDEALDVDGIDAAHKAAILATLAYGFFVPFDHVFVEGIRNLTPLDFDFASSLGYLPKLLATIKVNEKNAVEVRVHPTLIPKSHVLASIDGVYNAVAVEGDVVGNTLFYGRGAGADPTASAVLSDTIEVASQIASGDAARHFQEHHLYNKLITMDEVITRYYVRLTVDDKPGVLAQVADAFGKNNIGISSVIQPDKSNADGTIPLVLMLDKAKELVLQEAMQTITQLPVVKSPNQVIRLEDFEE
ncbi:MAG: homoserine dehydrogenase [Verrucomicrobiota bacterium]